MIADLQISTFVVWNRYRTMIISIFNHPDLWPILKKYLDTQDIACLCKAFEEVDEFRVNKWLGASSPATHTSLSLICFLGAKAPLQLTQVGRSVARSVTRQKVRFVKSWGQSKWKVVTGGQNDKLVTSDYWQVTSDKWQVFKMKSVQNEKCSNWKVFKCSKWKVLEIKSVQH